MKTVEQAYEEALKDINVQENEQIILKSDDPYYIYNFAKHVINADRQLLSQAMLATLDEYWIGKFYDDIDFGKPDYDVWALDL